MKKVLLCSMICMPFVTYSMHTAYKKDYRDMHIQKLRAAYPTLSPINKNNPDGTIVAYYFPGDAVKTRAIVHWYDGKNERPFLCNDDPLEIHNPDQDQSFYEDMKQKWEKHVELGLCKRLNLEQ